MDDIVLEMRDIGKSFGGVRALEGVNLKVRRGEIHGICGENGAGKSTLMKILSGVYPHGTYEGDIVIDGAVCRFSCTKDSERAGVIIIYQELALIKEMNVGENIYLGNEPTAKGVIDWNKLYSEAMKHIREVGLEINVTTKIKDIGVGKQQLVEIAKALSKSARILILDEPTAALTEEEVSILMDILRKLKERGVTCIYISHKLSEVMNIADRITVLRDGRTVSTEEKSDLSEGKIIKLMVGRELTERFPKETTSRGDKVFEVKDFSVRDRDSGRFVLKDISFSVYKGEVLGISGLMGAGRTELIMSLFGAMPAWEISGDVFINGRRVSINSPLDAINFGMGFVSEDRRRYGLVMPLSCQENISLASLKAVSRFSVIDTNEEIHRCKGKVDELRIKMRNLKTRVSTLSGGNQQKVIVARWLMTNPSLLFLDEPTRGIDVGAKYEIYTIINQLVKDGVAVVMVSSELPEILGMCDRVLVMREGLITGEFMRDDMTQEKIMECATGGHLV